MENQVNILIDILKKDTACARSLYRGRKLNVTKLPTVQPHQAIAATYQPSNGSVMNVA